MTAGLHRDFLELGAANALARPGDATVLGSPVDLTAVDRDSYIVAGITDHICPWQSCYASTQLLGGQTRFVLSTSGHIAAMVNPPDNAKASYQVGRERARTTPRSGCAEAETAHGLLVAGLHGLAGRALRGGAGRARGAGRRRARADQRRARNVRL